MYVTVLGGGHGVASVLRALRGDDIDLTAIVTVADDGGSSGELRRRWGGPAVGDTRRSLSALAGEQSILGRALARPITVHRVGRHPLGNLVLMSLVGAFGDLDVASGWLGEQLGVRGRVLPASAEPVRLVADTTAGAIRGESAIGASRSPILRLRFDPDDPTVPAPALAAVDRADWLLLAPGSLYTSTLSATAVPALARALADAPGRVVWICNLVPERYETARMSAYDHLAALRAHDIRVDALLQDPAAPLHLSSDELARAGLPFLSVPLQSPIPETHDAVGLRAALAEVFGGRFDVLPERPARHAGGATVRSPGREVPADGK